MVGLMLLIATFFPLLTILVLGLFRKANVIFLAVIIGFFQLVFLLATFLKGYHIGKVLQFIGPCFDLVKGYFFSPGIVVDFLTWVMLFALTLVNLFVAIYAVGYFKSLGEKRRYFIQTSCLTITIYGVVLSDNLFSIYLGWELVSLLSALLICFWNTKPHVAERSSYVFLMNKVGSICFLVALALLMHYGGGVSWTHLNQFYLDNAVCLSPWYFVVVSFLLVAIFTKMAQFPFIPWLPRAMVAPIPVSAMLHTATVLGIGVYLLCRIQPLLPAAFLNVVLLVGYLTMFLSSATAFQQRQTKRMLAYSTVSHLGTVVVAIGLGLMGYGILYFLIHTFVKVSLLLCLGMKEKFYIQPKDSFYSSQGSLLKFLLSLSFVGIIYFLAVMILIGLPGLRQLSIKELLLHYTFSGGIPYFQKVLYIGCLILSTLFIFTNFLTILYLARSVFLFAFLERNNKPVLIKEKVWFYLMQASIVVFLLVAFLISSTGVEKIFVQQFGNLLYPKNFVLKPLLENDVCFVKVISVITWIGVFIWLLASLKNFKKSTSFYHQKHSNIVLNNWYLYKITLLISRTFLTGSKWANEVEKIFNESIQYIGNFFIMIAKKFFWVEKNLLTNGGYGLVNFFKWLVRVYDNTQKSSIQFQLKWILGSIMIIMFLIGLLINNI